MTPTPVESQVLFELERLDNDIDTKKQQKQDIHGVVAMIANGERNVDAIVRKYASFAGGSRILSNLIAVQIQEESKQTWYNPYLDRHNMTENERLDLNKSCFAFPNGTWWDKIKLS